MTIDRDYIRHIFDEIGRRLTSQTTICLIGSTPGIVLGQPERQSQDIDIWRDASDYDETEFRRVCVEVGVLFDPRGEIDPNAIYVQIVQPGVVRLPRNFAVEVVGRYGALTVTMPEPALLSAAKLARGEAQDIGDVAWWMKTRALSAGEIAAAIGTLPDAAQRETAAENIVLVELYGPERERK